MQFIILFLFYILVRFATDKHYQLLIVIKQWNQYE